MHHTADTGCDQRLWWILITIEQNGVPLRNPTDKNHRAFETSILTLEHIPRVKTARGKFQQLGRGANIHLWWAQIYDCLGNITNFKIPVVIFLNFASL